MSDKHKVTKLIKTAFCKHGYLSKTELMKSSGVLCKGVKNFSGDTVISLSIHVQFWVSCEINTLQTILPGFSYKLFVDNISRELITQGGCQFFVPSSVDQFGLLLRQWIFRKKAEYRFQLEQLSKNADVISLFNEESEFDVESVFERDNAMKYLRLFVLKRWGMQTVFENYGKSLRYVLNRKRCMFAPIVYITGPDGASKTSVSSTLSGALDNLNLNYKHVYSIKRNIFRHKFAFLEKLFSPMFLQLTFGLLLQANAAVIADRKNELTPEEVKDYYRRLNFVLVGSKAQNLFHTIRTDIDFHEARHISTSFLKTLNNNLN